MAITRRQFLKGAAATGVGLALPLKFGVRSAHAFYQSPTTIPLFGTTLRGVGPGGIPVAGTDGVATVTGVTHYSINVNQYTDQIVPASSGLGPTTLWGYNPVNPLGGGTQPQKHLGGIIVAESGQPIQLTFKNNLSVTNGVSAHILPNDQTIPGANLGYNRLATHFHGGLVPWISDGGPFDWWDPAGNHGLSFKNNQVLNPANVGTAFAEYYYPLNQSARFGWYHDHAFGITRLNAYAGVASALLIRDNYERSLQNLGLPPFIETSVLSNGTIPIQELPLVIQDKAFVGANIALTDPTWPGPTAAGSLWYPHIYEKNRWKLGPSKLALPAVSCVPEAFGDTMLVNGTTFPEVPVEARRYRLRILNACNARFLNLQFYVDDGSPNGITLNPKTGVPTNLPALCDPNSPGLAANVLQIGTEGGFLPYPVNVPTNMPFNPVTLTGSLIVASAERPDILIDFKNYVGKKIILYNDAPAPFPAGDPRYDYFPAWNVNGNPVNGLTPPGFGPNTRVLMRFNVGAATGAADQTLNIATNTNLMAGNDTLLVPPGVIAPPPGVPVRTLTLNEAFDQYGRLMQLLGTAVSLGAKLGFGRAYTDPSTENVTGGTTEVWEIYNLTADTHPIHFHLVNVQLINRQPFNMQKFAGVPAIFTGVPVGPAPNETGWKETVMMHPGTVTRVIMQFNLPFITGPGPSYTKIDLTSAGGGLGTPPPSPRTGGNEYVWHCHILEHEEHDMMRPLIVT
jgi:spore coat protein A, manganese oxidase